MAGNDLENGGAGSSATGVFGTVGKDPVTDGEPVRAVPAPPVPVSGASSGGFTQLLRALNYDAVKEVPAAPVAAPVAGGPMTEMLRTMVGPAGETGVVSKPVPPSASAQVTSFLPPSAPVAAPPAAVPAPAQEGGSFTQLFQRLETEPVREIAPEKVSSPSFTKIIAVPKPMAERMEPSPSSPGSFTQLFAAVAPEPAVAAHPSTTAGVLGHAPVEEAEAAQWVEPDVPPALPQASPAGSPGSFTQMFQALGKPDEEVAWVVAPPGPAVMRKEETSPAPGSFTQMFQALGTPASEEARYVPPTRTEVARTDATPSTPGSFTQMFRTLDEEPRTATEPEGGPGSFTQLFGPAGASPVPSSPPPSSYQQPFAPSAPERGESGASQMFSTYQEPKAEPSRPTFSPVEPASMGRPPVSSAPASGGLTQLLRTLDQPTKAPAPYGGSSYPPPVAAAPPAPQAGSFTGVYGELGMTPAPAAVPTAPSIAPQPPVTAGPSEFTRLINASALREAGLRGGGQAAGAPAAPAATSASGASGFAMPHGMPAVPHASLGAPAAPHASISGPGGAHGSVSAAGASLSGPHLPSLSSAPHLKLPEASKAAGAPAGVQKYVPLLLILVIFLLLAILVAVVVLMKK